MVIVVLVFGRFNILKLSLFVAVEFKYYLTTTVENKTYADN